MNGQQELFSNFLRKLQYRRVPKMEVNTSHVIRLYIELTVSRQVRFYISSGLLLCEVWSCEYMIMFCDSEYCLGSLTGSLKFGDQCVIFQYLL
jgi:hypothetical protein